MKAEQNIINIKSKNVDIFHEQETRLWTCLRDVCGIGK